MAGKISLIVQPGDSFFPLLRAIDRAEKSVNITVFRLDDPIILNALVEARSRGVNVRALVATSARGWEDENRLLIRKAKKLGIESREPHGDSKKTRFHYKILTVDNVLSLVLTFNPTQENLHYTRDFGVELYDEMVAAELNRLFEADWKGARFSPDKRSPLLISPYNSRRKMLELLGGATKSIHISDAKVEDEEVLEVLRNKAAAGIDVRILCDYGEAPKKRSALQQRAMARFRLHAKCVIVDSSRAAIGSMNLRTESLDVRREVGILVENQKVVQGLEQVFQSDWEQLPPASMQPTAAPSRGSRPTVAPHHAGSGFVLISLTDALRGYTLQTGETTIGRADENEIVIADAKVSRFHARIEVRGDTCTVTDIDSANGTFVNGERIIGTRTLFSGDVVRVGDYEELRLLEV